jgi:hemerythrin-like domain-containing protein
MYPTELLMNEHRIIEQVLACLEAMAEQAVADEALDLYAARQAVDFFQNFADRCHHGKEEKALFPLLEVRGLTGGHGPTGRMLHEHVLGRRYLRALARAAEATVTGDRKSLQRFADQARAYGRWLREHIAREDEHVFPLADQALTDEDQRLLLRSFEKAESHDMGTGTHEEYLRIADELADRFQVARAQPEGAGSAVCTGCGHHALG